MLTLNQIYLMDCLEGMKEIPDKSIDMILCDLPYGTTQNEWDLPLPLPPLMDEYNRIIKDCGAIILTAEGLFLADLIKSNEKYFKYTLVWDKKSTTGFLNANRLPLRQHEMICVFYKNAPTYNPLMREGKERYKGGKKYANNGCYGDFEPNKREKYNQYFPTSIISISNSDQFNKIHPTQKPLALFEYLIKTYSNAGDLILDNCIGSGTTAEACIRTGRQFIGFEKEKTYFDAASIRIKKAMEQGKLKSEWF